MLDSIKKVYATTALVPLMLWKIIPLPLTPQYLKIFHSDRGNVLQWSPGKPDDPYFQYYVVYRFTSPQMDINESANIRSVVADTIFRDAITDTTAKYYYAVSALNRLQYESDISTIVSTAEPSIPFTYIRRPIEVIPKKELPVIKDTLVAKSLITVKLINPIEKPLTKGTDLNIYIKVAGNLIYSIYKEQTRITWGKIKTARNGVSVNLPGSRELEPGKYTVQMEMDLQKQQVPFEVR